MGAEQDFVDDICNCIAPGPFSVPFSWPSINGPGGLPNMNFSLFSSQWAGINYTLDFIPIDPENLPEVPSVDIFIDAALGEFNFPFNLPASNLEGISLPAYTADIPTVPPVGFDVNAPLKFLTMFIKLPFETIEFIIDEIVTNLTVTLPTVPEIKTMFADLAISLGFATQSDFDLGLDIPIVNLSGCVASALNDILTAGFA